MAIDLGKQEARIRLDKDMQMHAPNLIDLSKKADIVLEKRQLHEHSARVALVLDISASMSQLYQRGTVQAVTEKALALASRFDDDGQMDVFLFGKQAHATGQLGIKNIQHAINRLIKKHPLEMSTRYGLAIQTVREYYFPNVVLPEVTAPSGGGFLGKLFGKAPAPVSFTPPLAPQMPIFVIFITDGETTDQQLTIDEVSKISQLPVFFKFIGVGSESFGFLQKLDDLKNRVIDNADFVKFDDLDRVHDEVLYERLLQEYDRYVQKARELGLIAG